MIPVLFDERSTNFTSNGIGRLSDAISCIVTEERNGQYELEMEYPASGKHFESIGIRDIIAVIPSANATLQPFRIYSISRPINGRVIINAQHISYDLSKNVVMPFSVTASGSACASVLAGIKSNAVESCPFNFSTDVTTVASYTQTAPASIRQRLGGVTGSVLDQYGGEYEWNVYDVILHRHRGTTKNIPLRYGKNITDIKQEENISNTVTGIVPFWVDTDGNNLVTLPEKAVYSDKASNYSNPLTTIYDCSGDFQSQPTVEQLRSHARAYINQSGIGIPKVSIDLSFVNLADTEEYKDIVPLEQVSLCDIIPVQFDPLGISTTAEIVKTVYNVLTDRYDSISIGSLKSTLASTIVNGNSDMINSVDAGFAKLSSETENRISALSDSIEDEITRQRQDILERVDNATAWLTSSGGYVIAVKNEDGSWKELLFLDTDDVDTAHNVLRINENGIGFSSNGVSGPYTQAWTLDGRLVIGGTNVPSITVYDNSNNIIFQASADAMIWNAANSQMNRQGVITATGAQLNDVTINGGNITVKGGTTHLDIHIHDGMIEFVDPNTSQVQISMSAVGTGGLELIGSPLIMDDDNNPTRIFNMGASDFFIGSDNGDIHISTGNNQDIYIGSDNDLEFNVNGNLIMNGSSGYSGRVVTNIGESTINYISGASDFTFDRDEETISNMLWNVSMANDGTLNSWTVGDITLFTGFTMSVDAHSATAISNITSHGVSNGIITD